jgi:hypothetical protein
MWGWIGRGMRVTLGQGLTRAQAESYEASLAQSERKSDQSIH